MTHKDLLNLIVGLQSLLDRGHLLFLKSILEQVQVSQRQKVEEVGQGFTADLVIVNVNIAEVALALENLDQLIGTIVIDLIVAQLQLFQGMALTDKLTDSQASLTGDLVVGETKDMNALSLLVAKGLDNNFHSLISNIVSAQIQLLDSFAQT